MALVPVGGRLVGPADAQCRRLVIGPADDVQRQWQPGLGKAIRDREGAQLEQIDEPGEMRRGRRLVDGIHRDRRALRRRGQQCVDAVERGKKAALQRIALGERREIIAGADAAADLDARAHGVIDRQRRIVDQIADQLVGFRADDPPDHRRRIGEATG